MIKAISIALMAIFSSALLTCGCGPTTNKTNADLSTPEATFKRMIEVLKTEDIDGFIELMSEEKKEIATSERVEQMFKDWRQVGITLDVYDSIKLSRVEQKGDTAEVYFTMQGVEGTPYTLVKEGDSWKVDKW